MKKTYLELRRTAAEVDVTEIKDSELFDYVLERTDQNSSVLSCHRFGPFTEEEQILEETREAEFQCTAFPSTWQLFGHNGRNCVRVARLEAYLCDSEGEEKIASSSFRFAVRIDTLGDNGRIEGTIATVPFGTLTEAVALADRIADDSDTLTEKIQRANPDYDIQATILYSPYYEMTEDNEMDYSSFQKAFD